MKRAIAAFLLAALILAICTACGGKNASGATKVLPAVGEGKIVVTLLVTMPDGKRTSREVRTDKATLGEALRDCGIIACDDAGFVTTVDGVTANYSADQSYWAFYIGEEYAVHGVNDEIIADGNTYTLKYAKG